MASSRRHWFGRTRAAIGVALAGGMLASLLALSIAPASGSAGTVQEGALFLHGPGFPRPAVYNPPNALVGEFDWTLGGILYSSDVDGPLLMTGITVDTDANVYLADGVDTVHRLSSADGTFLRLSGFTEPAGLATSPSALFVADRGARRVVQHSLRAGTEVVRLSGADLDPIAVTVDASENLYVADHSGKRIFAVMADGSCPWQLDSATGRCSLPTAEQPDAIAASAGGDVYLAAGGRLHRVEAGSASLSLPLAGVTTAQAVVVGPGGGVFVGEASRVGVLHRAGFYEPILAGGAELLATYAPLPSFVPSTPPPGTYGEPYSHTYQGRSHSDLMPVTFRVISGSLPPGLTLDADTGVLSGVPTAPGTYHFRVSVQTAARGASQAQTIVVTGGTAPVVTAHPQSVKAAPGTSVSFSATADGAPAPTVQWQVDLAGAPEEFADVPGATSNPLVVTASAETAGNRYRARFANGIGSPTTTDAALLELGTPLTVTQQPQDAYVAGSGSTATFSAAATGDPPPVSVRWYYEGDGQPPAPWPGGETAAIEVTVTDELQDTRWFAVFTSDLGTTTTEQAHLRFITVPTILTQPTSVVVDEGDRAVFTVAVSGQPAPRVDWELSRDDGASWHRVEPEDGTDLDPRAEVLDLATTAVDDLVKVRAVATSAGGTASSEIVQLRVKAPPVIREQEQPVQEARAGEEVVLGPRVTSVDPFTTSWQVQRKQPVGSVEEGPWETISGATGPQLRLQPTIADDGNRYRAVFTNVQGATTSDPTLLLVTIPPTVTGAPADQSITYGSTATFEAHVDSYPQATVQWERSTDGISWTPLEGATTSTLTLTPTVADGGARYRAVFTNRGGSVRSSPATLVVARAPLTVTADDTARVFGAPNPPFTVTLSGFVAGETSDVVSGAPACTSTATSSSSAAGGPYPITCTVGSLQAANYSFGPFIPGELTIDRAGTALQDVSLRRSLFGLVSSFDARLVRTSDGAPIAGHEVHFRIGGTAVCMDRTDATGRASCSALTLILGSRSWSAVFAGDADHEAASATRPL